MNRILMTAAAALAVALPAAAQVDETASEEEAARVAEAISAFGCEAPDRVEKETDTLYELDDVVCAGGQYDIKLDGAFVVTSMTFDGPVDEDGEEVEASDEEIAEIAEVLETIGCEAAEVEKESDNLYELDDAVCGIGQYDIKLDGEYTLLSMTFDGPAEEGEEAALHPATIAAINEMLAGMQCEIDEADIEAAGGGYELDDVFCADGQYDMVLDGDLEIVERRKE